MLADMNWKTVVTELLEWSGMSETDLANVVGTTQPTINRIKRGRTKTPVYDIAVALERLHKSASRRRQRESKAAA